MSLRDDFRMYYLGSYVSRVVDGQRRVMYVSDVGYNNHGRNVSDITLSGQVFYKNANGSIVSNDGETWAADSLSLEYPESGYYMLQHGPRYLEFIVQNRTNRKGFEPGRVTSGGEQLSLNGTRMASLFFNDDFPGKLFDDCVVHRSRVLWRGNDVGSFHDGVLNITEDYVFLRDYLDKHINKLLNASQGGTNGDNRIFAQG